MGTPVWDYTVTAYFKIITKYRRLVYCKDQACAL